MDLYFYKYKIPLNIATTEYELKKALIEQTKLKQDKREIKNFEQAAKHFDELVARGVISRRGNQQLSVMDAHLKRYRNGAVSNRSNIPLLDLNNSPIL